MGNTLSGTDQITSTAITGGTPATQSDSYAGTDQVQRLSAGATSFTAGRNGEIGQPSLQSTTTGSTIRYFVRDNKGNLISMVTASTSTPAVSASSAEDYYVTDASGNVTRLVDLNGATMASYTYDPYGGHATATGTDAATNPYRFASAYLDTATGLYKMGARYYNPTRERFLSQDSVTHTGDLTQGNRYSYAGDNPVSNLDPAGSSLLGTVLGGAAKAITLGTSFFPGPIADAGALVGAGLDVGAGLADGESASEIAGTAVLDASTALVPFGAGKAAEAAGAADGLEGTLRGISVGYGALAVGGGSAIEYGSGD